MAKRRSKKRNVNIGRKEELRNRKKRTVRRKKASIRRKRRSVRSRSYINRKRNTMPIGGSSTLSLAVNFPKEPTNVFNYMITDGNSNDHQYVEKQESLGCGRHALNNLFRAYGRIDNEHERELYNEIIRLKRRMLNLQQNDQPERIPGIYEKVRQSGEKMLENRREYKHYTGINFDNIKDLSPGETKSFFIKGKKTDVFDFNTPINIFENPISMWGVCKFVEQYGGGIGDEERCQDNEFYSLEKLWDENIEADNYTF